jgi:phosphopantothenoylcysteine synthetase/decarboxylase
MLEQCLTPIWSTRDLSNYFNRWAKYLYDYDENLAMFLQNYESWIDKNWIKSKSKWNIKHINLSEKIDLAIIAPTTVNTLAKITNWITDNFLLETIRAMNIEKKVYLALAMNTNMLNDPFTIRNIDLINQYWDWKYLIIEPKEWLLQCGIYWKWAMADIDTIIKKINS